MYMGKFFSKNDEGVQFCSTIRYFIKTKIHSFKYIFKNFGRSLTQVLYRTVKQFQNHVQKQPSRGSFRERCTENIQQSQMQSKFIKITLRRGCSLFILMHIFSKNLFIMNTSGGCLDCFEKFWENHFIIISEFSD